MVASGQLLGRDVPAKGLGAATPQQAVLMQQQLQQLQQQQQLAGLAQGARGVAMGTGLQQQQQQQ